jgi:hypothetical protein
MTGTRVSTIARFLLVGIIPVRAGAICVAALEPTESKGWIDVAASFTAGPKESRSRKSKSPVPGLELIGHGGSSP